jgi:hypothetical protein
MIDSYRLKRDDIFLGKKLSFGESGNITFTRIGQKSTSWKRPVHEVWESTSSKMLSHSIVHHSADSVEDFVNKINFYTTLNAKYLFQNKVHVHWWDLIIFPIGKFMKNYIVKQGFRDGIHGFLHAIFMSFHSFLTRAKLWLLYHA